MKIVINAEIVRRPSFSNYRHDRRFPNARVIGSRYSSDSDAAEVTVEKVTDGKKSYVILNGDLRIDLSVFESIMSCLNEMAVERFDFWTLDDEERAQKSIDEEEAEKQRIRAAEDAEHDRIIAVAKEIAEANRAKEASSTAVDA